MASLSDSQRILGDSFNKYTSVCYWHTLAAHKDNPSDYESKKIEKRIKQISEKLGSNSFNIPQGPLGFRPIHIAVIRGNCPAIKFFLSKQVSLEEKDINGKTANEYLREYHPDLVSLFIREKPPITQDIVDALPRIRLSQDPCFYRENTDDFGIIINTLLFAMQQDSAHKKPKYYEASGARLKHTLENIISVCKKLGINLETTTSPYMVRDHWIGHPDGTFVVPDSSPSAIKAIERNESSNLVQGRSAAYLTAHAHLKTTPGAVLDCNLNAVMDVNQKFGSVSSLLFFMEGGNHYLVSNKCKLQLIIGSNIVQTALLQFRLDRFFDDPKWNMKKKVQITAPKLTTTQISGTIQEMYAQGLILNPKGKGFISHKERKIINLFLPFKGPVNYLQIAQDSKYFTPLELDIEQIENFRSIAAKYLTQKALTKQIIAQSFSVDPEELIVVPQADYHLDIFMRPGPKNSFFVQDYQCVITLLTNIKSQAKELKLTDEDMKMLERYLETAQELDQQLKPLFDKTYAKLVKEGFTVIPTPGILQDISPRILKPNNPIEATTYNLNFMNGISGFSPKTNRYFYITVGAQVGDHLGKIIMDIFEKFLQSYQENLDVFYVGYDPDNPRDFSEGMYWGNFLGGRFGIHCLSNPIKTESHLG